VKEKVMGSSDSGTRHAGRRPREHGAGQGLRLGTVQARLAEDKAGDKATTRRRGARAPQAVRQQTQGNPLAAGIIAFGVGMLAATLIPVTDARSGPASSSRSTAAT
jgi:hypothetical protein